MNKICSKCIMDSSDPNILFDCDGVCNYCYEAKRKTSYQPKEVRDKLIAKIKRDGEGKKYDCLIGISGGMDSSLALHRILGLGLRPLCFSIDNSWNTKLADENIMRLVETLKVPFFKYILDKETIKEFYKLQFAFLVASVPNAEIPSDHIIVSTAYKIAKENNIKYIISGGNDANEGTMPESWSYSSLDLDHIKHIYHTFIGEKIKKLPMMSLFQYGLNKLRIKTINLLDYYNYDNEETEKLLKEKYGWKPYHAKHCESAYTCWYQEYYLPRKFGIDKRKAHFSSLIHSGQMTRDEALEKLNKPLSNHQNISREIMRRFELTPSSFDEMMSLPIRKHIDYITGLWKLKLMTKIYAFYKK